MKFIAIKNLIEYEKIIVDVFKQLAGNNIKSENKDNIIFIYADYENNEDIKDMLLAFEASLMTNIFAYISTDTSSVRLEKEEKLAIELLNVLKPGVYDLKSALITNPILNDKSDILSYILDGTGINETFVKGFVESNLNVSQAAKNMFIHRNTMIYKLDKLRTMTGFDIREFKDAFILYLLINDR